MTTYLVYVRVVNDSVVRVEADDEDDAIAQAEAMDPREIELDPDGWDAVEVLGTDAD